MRPPTGLIGAGALLATLVGALLWLHMLAGPLRLATGMLEARSHLTSAQRALANGKFRKAVYETYAARAAAVRARRGLEQTSPLMDLATLLPAARGALGEAGHLVSALVHAADAARGSLEIGLGALRGPGRIVVPDPRDPGGSMIRIERVEELGRVLEEVTADLRAARADLQAVELSRLPRRLRPDVRRAAAQAADTLHLLDRARAGFAVLPAVLGAEGPRTYMIGFQNSAELRGSGGALLQFEFLTIDQGRPRLASTSRKSVGSIYKLDEDREPLSIPLPPDAWYVRAITDAQRFGNFNWSPDWPMNAHLAIAYGEASERRCEQRGEQDCPQFPEDLDGVIAVDPVAVKKLIPGTGPFNHRAFRISRSRVLEVLLSDAYAYYPVPSDRRAFLGDLVSKFFRRLFNPAHPTELVTGFGSALSSKHVQIWMRDPQEQSVVELMDWDGAIRKARRAGYLYVVQQNVGGNKLDYPATQTTELDVELTPQGDARVETRVTIDNNIVLPQPRWVLGDSKGSHRPMVNVYVPSQARLLEADAGRLCPFPLNLPANRSCNGRIDTPAPAAWTQGVPPEHLEKGKKVWSATLQIPPGQSGSFSLSYEVPGVVRRTGDRFTYRLVLQRQPKVTPELLRVRLRLPPGAEDVLAPGFRRQGRVLVLERPLKSDTELEVSWRR